MTVVKSDLLTLERQMSEEEKNKRKNHAQKGRNTSGLAKKERATQPHPTHAPSQPTRHITSLDLDLQTRLSHSKTLDPFIHESCISAHSKHQR